VKKIIVITTEGGDREDGSVYYSDFVLVESLSLQFDEPVFKDASKHDTDSFKAKLIELGYIIHDTDSAIVEVSNYIDDDDDEDA
jgi:hypothetical protein